MPQQDAAFRRLTFTAMLAWQRPYQEDLRTINSTNHSRPVSTLLSLCIQWSHILVTARLTVKQYVMVGKRIEVNQDLTLFLLAGTRFGRRRSICQNRFLNSWGCGQSDSTLSVSGPYSWCEGAIIWNVGCIYQRAMWVSALPIYSCWELPTLRCILVALQTVLQINYMILFVTNFGVFDAIACHLLSVCSGSVVAFWCIVNHVFTQCVRRTQKLLRDGGLNPRPGTGRGHS